MIASHQHLLDGAHDARPMENRCLVSEVRRAIIPCGGKGTRMLSISRRHGEGARADRGRAGARTRAARMRDSGIEHVLVVVSPGKDAVVEFVKSLAGSRGDAGAHRHRGAAPAARARGCGARGSDFAGDEPVAIALPDNLFVDTSEPAVAQVIASYVRTCVRTSSGSRRSLPSRRRRADRRRSIRRATRR